MPQLKKDFVSDIDQWLENHHKNQPRTPQEQAEIDQHTRIRALRDRKENNSETNPFD